MYIIQKIMLRKSTHFIAMMLVIRVKENLHSGVAYMELHVYAV